MEELSEAEEYELFGYPDTATRDCNFLESIFSASGRQIHDVLDLACGTGRHAVEMAKRGYSVTGIDVSNDMLRIARKKATDQNLRVMFIKGDITQLDFQEEFDAGYILFNTMSLLTRNDDLIKFFEGMHLSLKENGLLVTETVNMWRDVAEGDFKNMSWNTDEQNAGVRRHREIRTFIGPYNNVECLRENNKYWRNGEELQPRTRLNYMRLFSVNEFDLLCRLTKFRMLQIFGSTDINRKIEDPDRIEEIEKPHGNFVLVLQKSI